MDFELNDDERSMQEGIATFLAGRVGIERVREGVTRALWTELAEAGVFSLLADEFGWRAVGVVFEELGAACVPGPLVWSLLTAGLIPGVAEGTTIVTGVAEETPDRPVIIEFPDLADAVAVLGANGIRHCEVPEVQRSEWPLDPLTPVGIATSLAEGAALGSASMSNSLQRAGALATAAYCVGLARRCTELAVEYSLERRQFDRPIASFQAMKHLCADMAVRTEMARHAMYVAAVLMDDAGEGDTVRAISAAKLLAGEAAVANGRGATQVFGGMGFTWEVDVHLYLKRAWVMETHFGSSALHADAMAQHLVAAASWSA